MRATSKSQLSLKMSTGDITACKDTVEVLARNLFDIGFKYNWTIEDYLKGVDEEINVDSPVFEVTRTVIICCTIYCCQLFP